MALMTQRYRDIIYNKYRVVLHLEFKQFDHDFAILEEQLRSIKKQSFAPNERIIIEHMDTDYYCDELACGLGLFNLFTAFQQVDIPLFTMLLFTNHFGIQREIDVLAPNASDRPTVIETFINKIHYTNDYETLPLDQDQIQRPGLCMMGHPRVHRHAMYRFLEKENLLSLVATSIQGKA
jgi:hypothetical protein